MGAVKARGAGDNQAKIVKWLREHPGEHGRAEIETGTRLPKGSVVGALRVLREDGKVNVTKRGEGVKAPLFYSVKK